jgi:ABC-2 type transport system permease protein
MSAFLDTLFTQYRVSLASGIQYRAGITFQFLGKMAEPLVYLIVWTTVATQTGGSVGGYTANDFIVYFIAWTLVRQMTVAWDPYYMERRIRRGEFTPLLLRPIHPFYVDTMLMLAFKTVELVTLIPTILILTLIFQPVFSFPLWAVVTFIPALMLAFALRFTLNYALALTAFWTTRVTALFHLYFAVEFFLSGRIAPLTVLPIWAQQIANWLPFQWMFYFPLEVLLGRVSGEQLVSGFLMQLLWFGISILAVALTWRWGVKKYTAVGG